MKKFLVVLCSMLIVFLVACGDEQIYDGQDYYEQPVYQYHESEEYYYNKDNQDEQGGYGATEENVLAENAHPFAVILADMMNNVPYYVTDFLVAIGGYSEIDAFLVDIDGNGTLGMLIRTWERYHTGAILRRGTLFYLYNGNLQYTTIGSQVPGFAHTTILDNNRLVQVLGDGGQFGYQLYVIENGVLTTYVNIFSQCVFLDVNSMDAVCTYYINGEPVIQEEVYELRMRYGFDNIHFRTEEEIQAKTLYILSMTMD